MVVCERPTTNVYDPFDSINHLLDNLELESNRIKKLTDEPWQAYYPGRKPSPIEEPRASSSNSQNRPQRITPPQGFFVPPKRQSADENQPPPVKSDTHRPLHRSSTAPQPLHRPSTAPQPLSTRTNGQPLHSANPRVVKSTNWMNKNEQALRNYQPNYASNHRQYVRQPASAPPVPQLHFDFEMIPKRKHFSEPQPLLYDYEYKEKKKHSRRSHGDLKSICKSLSEFREKFYKGSMREHEFRLQQVEECQRRVYHSSLS